MHQQREKTLEYVRLTVGVGEGRLFGGVRKGRESVLPSIQAWICEW